MQAQEPDSATPVRSEGCAVSRHLLPSAGHLLKQAVTRAQVGPAGRDAPGEVALVFGAAGLSAAGGKAPVRYLWAQRVSQRAGMEPGRVFPDRQNDEFCVAEADPVPGGWPGVQEPAVSVQIGVLNLDSSTFPLRLIHSGSPDSITRGQDSRSSGTVCPDALLGRSRAVLFLSVRGRLVAAHPDRWGELRGSRGPCSASGTGTLHLRGPGPRWSVKERTGRDRASG